MESFIFALGPDPYADGNGLSDWGQRKGKFPDLSSALHTIIAGHPFPAVLVGRHRHTFIDGISIPGAGGHEVIQVWCSDPRAIANLDRFEAAHPEATWPHRPHNGDGTDMGLLAEVHVRQIAEYQQAKVSGLLTDGTNARAHTSPAGRFALSMTYNVRNELQIRLMQSQIAGLGSRLELEGKKEEIEEQMAKFREGFRMMNAYTNGTHGLQTLAQGDRAPADEPYRIFQSRVYLDEELGLLMNLVEMDHQHMPEVDAWLMESGQWKKLLPYPKCILVTRICRESKEYHGRGALEAMYHNHFNMESLVWIRDGENLTRFATDIQFEERIFPTGDDAPKLVSKIQEAIWAGYWSGRREAEWMRHREDKTMTVVDPANESEPVEIAWKHEKRYPTLEEFMVSVHYTPELEASIQRRAADAIRQHSREMMPFALLLQGIIDHKRLLNIPPGTDIFDPIEQGRYISLVSDFSHGIADSRYAEQFARLTNIEALKPGDRIIGWQWAIYSEKWDHAAHWNDGARGEGPFLFTVRSVEPVDPKQVNWAWRYRLRVHHYALTKRWVQTSPFTKKDSFTTIHADEWLPADLPVSLAERLLDDRSWKRAHKWAVPLLARWKEIKATIPPPSDSPMPVTLEIPTT